ncbi:uncharacterized protein [Epargyreus clarus]|uniref:uncharacterized protein n=1 Tax=Epargyreus clarus TaxID=520877 RepID=UPI003C306AAE
MSKRIILTIIINLISFSNSQYFDKVSSKSKLEKNNVLNKGLWMKEKVEKSNYGDFIFRADSTDVDNLLQNNFDAFSENYMDTVPIFSSYVERNKRSAIHKQNERYRKSVKKCKDNGNCSKKDDTPPFKSKFISRLKPASVFNDYPYEVAMLLATTNKREINNNTKGHNEEDFKNLDKFVEENVLNRKLDRNISPLDKIERDEYNKSVANPKRMARPGLESEAMNKLELVEIINNTQHIDGNKIHRNVFDKEDRMWQSAPIENVAYNVIPRPESTVKNKPVTEKGLVKVLALLTKTFRKVMKQHNEIQEIDNKLHSLNEDFMKNVANLDSKFQDFDSKYAHLLKIDEESKILNEKFTRKNEDFKLKEIEMSNNMIEFENQQKKFLAQQRQFYTIQKLMLEQNEKINLKQNLIAKTQSEISRRQNNFARVLKKAKQLYIENKMQKKSKLQSILMKPKNTTKTKAEDSEKNIFTTSTPVTTESVKINLFSIPKIGPLLNQDKLIINEKDDQPIDDLVYKYYFNNTFIDNLMKSKVLTAIMNNEGKDTRNAKSKRNKLINLDSTILLPVENSKDMSVTRNLQRERRWIRHTKKGTNKFHGKEVVRDKKKENVESVKVKESKDKNDPFLTMATHFCVEVGQNLNTQMLNWCIEKSLRRLKSIDMQALVKPTASSQVESITEKLPQRVISSLPNPTKLFPIEVSTLATEQISTTYFPSGPGGLKEMGNVLITEKGDTEKPRLFFPDNEELESNVKQFELNPDPEGTVYFDGSLHTSDIVLSESDALSDVMPGLDSNSHVDVDPMALDLQAKRRAFVRRLNEKILKNIRS